MTESTLIPRFLRLQCDNPFQPSNLSINDASEIMEICIPMDLYVESAVSFGQFKSESYANLQLYYTMILQLMAMIANEGVS